MGGLNAGWLAQLAPPHAPPPPGWWPPAPGWWGVALLAVAAVAALLAWWRHPGLRLRRRALAELKRIEAAGGEAAALACAVEDFLRRYAMARYGRERVARLSGARWLAFVAEEGGAPLAGEAGRALLCLAYGGRGAAQQAAWIAGARAFVKGRRRRKR